MRVTVPSGTVASRAGLLSARRGSETRFTGRGANMARAAVVAVLGCAALLAVALSSGAQPAVMMGTNDHFDVSRLTQRHMNSVASNDVDSATAKGIWHSKNQAWAGIDEVLPTDTPYAYQNLHSGGGDEIKMRAFIEHANTQLRNLAKSLPKSAAGEDGKRLSTLKKLLAAGETAVQGIEVQTAGEADPDHAAKVAWAQSLSVMPSSSSTALRARPTQLATNAHYETAESASDDLDSYFDTMGRQTQRSNARNANKAGYRRSKKATQVQRRLPHLTPPPSRALPSSPYPCSIPQKRSWPWRWCGVLTRGSQSRFCSCSRWPPRGRRPRTRTA